MINSKEKNMKEEKCGTAKMVNKNLLKIQDLKKNWPSMKTFQC